ncbi:unnamed protein product [Phaedon cochleariae]|uniref:Poly(A) RNA polymerase, mitochondrial n=1 Tax=Phaedon cochleariae TaxID=80249 RepID=A0A9N9X3N6_PHACE|nr:unnamed protein product [Phaedon cochleariae]
MFQISHYFTCYSKMIGTQKISTAKIILQPIEKILTKELRRHFSSQNKKHANILQTQKFVPFIERVEMRRAEAKRSIIVQVQSAQSSKELQSYCDSIGTVQSMFHYTSGVEPLHFIIVEFEKESDVKNVLQASSQIDHIEETMAVPTQSHFLWFRASNRKLTKLKQNKSTKLLVQNGTNIVGEDEIKEMLTNCETVSDQLKKLHKITKLNDVGTRLRFLTAVQVEDALSGIFPNARAFPFGSSVNGYGKMGCDLDLVLRLVNDKKDSKDSRLIFHCKPVVGSERLVTQRHMETVGDLIHLFLPGCGHVRRILQARVPIIKYHQQLTDVECDLSMSNLTGVHMSDFLYMMGEIDDRVRPLIFAIRKWASAVGLTNLSPGRWISNFSLTLLVLAFLQKPLNSPPILPSLNKLTSLAGPKDQYVLDNGITCSFLRDLRKLNTKTQNTESLESLLCEFFAYYSQFDFNTKAVCLNEAVSITKPEHTAMYIINPLERGLNVSKNVSLDEVERFKNEVRTAAWTLESQENKSRNWGLLSILESKKRAVSNGSINSKNNRLMEVRALFDKERQEANFQETNSKNLFNDVRKDIVENIEVENGQR